MIIINMLFIIQIILCFGFVCCRDSTLQNIVILEPSQGSCYHVDENRSFHIQVDLALVRELYLDIYDKFVIEWRVRSCKEKEIWLYDIPPTPHSISMVERTNINDVTYSFRLDAGYHEITSFVVDPLTNLYLSHSPGLYVMCGDKNLPNFQNLITEKKTEESIEHHSMQKKLNYISSIYQSLHPNILDFDRNHLHPFILDSVTESLLPSRILSQVEMLVSHFYHLISL
jgi:hypothetical protein